MKCNWCGADDGALHKTVCNRPYARKLAEHGITATTAQRLRHIVRDLNDMLDETLDRKTLIFVRSAVSTLDIAAMKLEGKTF